MHTLQAAGRALGSRRWGAARDASVPENLGGSGEARGSCSQDSGLGGNGPSRKGLRDLRASPRRILECRQHPWCRKEAASSRDLGDVAVVHLLPELWVLSPHPSQPAGGQMSPLRVLLQGRTRPVGPGPAPSQPSPAPLCFQAWGSVCVCACEFGGLGP